MPEEQIRDVPLRDIQIHRSNVRHTDADRDLEELMASIKKHGLLQPVVLRGRFDHPPYSLIVGQRRFLAHERLGEEKIRATFAGELSDVDVAIRSLAENMHRTPLNHADAAEAVTKLYKHFGKNEKRVVAETGMSLNRVRQYIAIEERASQKMKAALRSRRVEPVDVQRALRAASGNMQKADELLEKMQEYKLTKYQKDHAVEYGEAHPQASADTILTEAKRPRVERVFTVKLPENVRKGLETAAREMRMDADHVAVRALEDWLTAQGFLR